MTLFVGKLLAPAEGLAEFFCFALCQKKGPIMLFLLIAKLQISNHPLDVLVGLLFDCMPSSVGPSVGQLVGQSVWGFEDLRTGDLGGQSGASFGMPGGPSTRVESGFNTAFAHDT